MYTISQILIVFAALLAIALGLPTPEETNKFKDFEKTINAIAKSLLSLNGNDNGESMLNQFQDDPSGFDSYLN